MSTQDLKACPFCESRPMLHHRKWKEYGWSIRCTCCGLQLGDFKTKQAAIDQWNTRPRPDAGEEVRAMPKIVCLCGSTRFWREFQRASLRETLEGRIVLSIGAASGTDDEHFGNLSREEYVRVKTMLDELHKRKIDLADEVLVLNVDGYIGSSTRSEIEHAIAHNKPVKFLEADKEPDWLRSLLSPKQENDK